MNKIITSKNVITYKANKECELNPIFELFRGKKYLFILKNFINNCTYGFGKTCFSFKKSYKRTLTNLLASWFFTLYLDYDFSDDSFFPSSCENTSLLDQTLRDFTSQNTNIENKDEKINTIISNLKKDYYIVLNEIDNYINCDYYKDNKDSYRIMKKLIVQYRDGTKVDFYKFTINTKFKINNLKHTNIINNVLIPCYVYDKLKNKYSGPDKMLDTYVWIIIYRYQLLGSNNHQLAVVPQVLDKMSQVFNLNFECFASSINSITSNYCSLYYDVEKYFGSCGSFFNSFPTKGTFSFNPPYQTDVICRGVNKLFKLLDKATDDLTFIITIPIWDNEGKEIMNKKYNSKPCSNIDYGDFEIIKDINDSIYFKAKKMISKDDFTYLDHNFHLYKNTTIQHTYIFILSNKTFEFQEELDKIL